MKQITSVILLYISLTINSFAIYQFEDGIPNNIAVANSSTVSLETNTVKDGKFALKWTFNSKDILTINENINYKPFKKGQKEKSRISYVMWLYNKTPITDKMTVQFKKNNKIICYFDVNMNFKGWRTMWVQYDRDMTGTPEVGINKIEFIAPNTQGEIIIDSIIPNILIDPRYNARDEQVSFINLDADSATNAHWMALYKNYNQITSSYHKISPDEVKSIKLIQDKVQKDVLKKVEVNQNLILQKEAMFNIYKTKFLTTPQIVEVYSQLPKANLDTMNFLYLKEFGKFMKDLANMYNSTNNLALKVQIYNIFSNCLDYMYNQGWTKGSSQGTIHHLGYSMKDIYESIFLMKKSLQENKKLEDAKKMVTWYSSLGMIYNSQNKEINIDILNTMLPGMLISILLDEDNDVVASNLKVLQNYLNNGILFSPGLSGGFKNDGSVFHHMQTYPAYAKGAFEGLTPIIYYLGNTPFQLSEAAYSKVKKSLLMMRIYSNKYNWLLSLSGRHPTGKSKIPVNSFGYLALGQKNIDSELAQAYLRLTSKGKFSNLFTQFKAEKSPNGSWTMNMSSLQLQRRKNWLVGIKGFSKYLVSGEIYKKNNIFGRYTSYGSIQILQNSIKESGFVQEGWDWNHFPGTTAISLPFNKLKSSIAHTKIKSGVEESLLSDESYSGGNSLNGNGIFAMKLHENEKYNNSHKARKSAFLFDNKVILLGTNIENNDQEHETHTTIFQNYLEENIIKTKTTFINENIILDSQNNLYKIIDGKLVYNKGNQKSVDQSSGNSTENPYELAYINHGTNPKNENYEYSILIQGTAKEQNDFIKNPQYKILQKDYNAHIVQDTKTKMIGYALFEPGEIYDKYIKFVDTPSLILISPNKNKLEISFVDPDLRLYQDNDFIDYDKNEKIKNVSIYSKPWNKNNSIPHTSTIEIHGKYKMKKTENVQISYKDENTILKITTTYATPVKIVLEENNRN